VPADGGSLHGQGNAPGGHPKKAVKPAQARNPYGDGQAAERIMQVLAHLFVKKSMDLPHFELWDPKLNRTLSA